MASNQEGLDRQISPIARSYTLISPRSNSSAALTAVSHTPINVVLSIIFVTSLLASVLVIQHLVTEHGHVVTAQRYQTRGFWSLVSAVKSSAVESTAALTIIALSATVSALVAIALADGEYRWKIYLIRALAVALTPLTLLSWAHVNITGVIGAVRTSVPLSDDMLTHAATATVLTVQLVLTIILACQSTQSSRVTSFKKTN